MHVVTRDNFQDAVEATGNILLMYADLASLYGGFGHAVDVHIRFDVLTYVDARSDGKANYLDMELLRSGSAIAMLCWYYDLWCEEQCLRSASNGRALQFETALRESRLAAFPDIESVLRTALERDRVPLEDAWFDEVTQPIYRRYVKGFFRRLAEADRCPTASSTPPLPSPGGPA